MDWIERTVSDSLSKLHQEAVLSDPWGRQAARLAILYGLSQSRRLGKKKLRAAKQTFQKEVDEYIASGSLGARKLNWDPDGRELIAYHYGRLMALTLAIELVSGKSSVLVAQAIREEANGLCKSYFRWCDYLIHAGGDPVH